MRRQGKWNIQNTDSISNNREHFESANGKENTTTQQTYTNELLRWLWAHFFESIFFNQDDFKKHHPIQRLLTKGNCLGFSMPAFIQATMTSLTRAMAAIAFCMLIFVSFIPLICMKRSLCLFMMVLCIFLSYVRNSTESTKHAHTHTDNSIIRTRMACVAHKTWDFFGVCCHLPTDKRKTILRIV